MGWGLGVGLALILTLVLLGLGHNEQQTARQQMVNVKKETSVKHFTKNNKYRDSAHVSRDNV